MNQTRMKTTPSLLNFPQIWWQSFTDIRVYRSLIHLPAWFGFVYSFVLYGALAIISTLIFQFRTLPVWTNTALATWEELRSSWPNDMVLRYEDQKLNFENISEPLIVPYPSTAPTSDSLPTHLASIQTSMRSDETPFQELSTPVLFGLTQDRLVIQPTQNAEITETNSSPWSELIGEQAFVLQKSDLETHNEDLQQALRRGIQILVVPYFFVAWVGLWLARIFFLALYALFAQTLFWMFGTKIKYSAIFRLGLFTLPVVELVPLLWRAIYGSVLWPSSYWWIWLVLIAFLAWYNRQGKILEL